MIRSTCAAAAALRVGTSAPGDCTAASMPAGLRTPLKPTIMTAPISWRSVSPPGPGIASWPKASGGALADGVALDVECGAGGGPPAVTGGAQAASEIMPATHIQRIAGG